MTGTANMWIIQAVTIHVSSMSLFHLSFRRETGAENMATDMQLLEKCQDWGGPIFRRYGWAKPQITFGYGQNAGWVEKETGQRLDNLIRRPTGGGIVRHGADLTYCMILPKGSKGEQIPSMEFYGLIHQRWGEALSEHGIPNVLMPCPAKAKGGIPGDCFKEPVGRDLMDGAGEKKLGGAAMKRTRAGVLIQGTLNLGEWPGLDYGQMEKEFLERITRDLGESITPTEWPNDWNVQRVQLVETFSSLSWTRDRKSS